MDHGQTFGIKNVGQIAMESLRIQNEIPKMPNELAFEKYNVRSWITLFFIRTSFIRTISAWD